MLFTICSVLFLSSTAITLVLTDKTNTKIEAKGYDIIPDERSIFKQLVSFVADYGYLLIPGYNIYKTMQDVFFKHLPEERMVKLRKRGRLVPHKEEKVSKEEKSKEEVKEEKKSEDKKLPEKTKTTTKRNIPVVSTDVEELPEMDINTLEYEAQMHADLDRYYRKKHAELKSSGASVEELNIIAKRLWKNREEYDMIQNQINSLKQNNSMKLIRK